MATRKKTTQKKVEDLRGRYVSLDLSQRTFFGVGDIWLSPENPVSIVPEDISSEDLELLNKTIASGVLKIGKTFCPPVLQDQITLKQFDKLVESTPMTTRIADEVKTKFFRLLTTGRAGGWTAYEIITYCIAKEESRRARKLVVDYLREVLDTYDGPKKLFTVPEGLED